MMATSPRMSLFKGTSSAFPRTSLSRKTSIVAKAAQPSTPNGKTVLESFAKPVSLTTLSSLVLTLPAYADAGKLLEINFTLPIMAIQFLLLMVFLDKAWFTPVGEILDKRDKFIRDELASVASRTDEIEKLEKDASDILKKARVEAQSSLNKNRREIEAKNETVFGDAKSKSDAEVAAAFANFQKERDEAMKSLEIQVDALAEQILRSVVPQGVAKT